MMLIRSCRRRRAEAILLIALLGISGSRLTDYSLAYLTTGDSTALCLNPGHVAVLSDETAGLRIQNKGNAPCYIRVSLDFHNSEAEAACVFVPAQVPGPWTCETEDGCYYYTEAVSKGGFTDPLFASVQQTDGSSAAELFDIYAECVSAYGFETYEEAWNEEAF